MDKWEVYMKIRQLLEQGFSKKKIAEKLGISRPTLYRYLKKDPQKMADWMKSIQTRSKKLDPYRDQILGWLKEHPDMSAAQVEDWLKERHPSLQVAESTVRSYVRQLRVEYDLPKEKNPRTYEAVPEKGMGEQAQVDFGQTTQDTPKKQRVKLYFIAFQLSHSRYKYMEWLDRPFTTRDVISAHENAFQWFGGIPHEMVYDQDGLIVVSENGGDLILTEEFQAYREERRLKLRVCRKADPESKGKIESAVGYIKRNFAANRTFTNLESWNEAAWEWLNRTGNGKMHNTTKKRPIEVFQKEKQHLRPVTKEIYTNYSHSSIPRTVRKDNTIRFESNRYSVPLGTYNCYREVYVSKSEDQLLIYASPEGPLIAKHPICHEKGQLIQDRSHTRDRSKGIDAFMETVSQHFTDTKQAQQFLEEVRERYPRYIRDQLQIILKHVKKASQSLIDQALKECVRRQLFCATDFGDMMEYLERHRQKTVTEDSCQQITEQKSDQSIHRSPAMLQTDVEQRDVNQYLTVLEGQQ